MTNVLVAIFQMTITLLYDIETSLEIVNNLEIIMSYQNNEFLFTRNEEVFCK